MYDCKVQNWYESSAHVNVHRREDNRCRGDRLAVIFLAELFQINEERAGFVNGLGTMWHESFIDCTGRDQE